jgi:hypothetical protein
MTRPKRKYTRLSPSKWAELRAFWEAGDHSLAELSHRYGISQRAIQTHVSKHGSIKGAKAAEMAAVVQKEIFKQELGDQDTLVFRAREMREAAYANAIIIEGLVMAQLQNAQKDPTQAFKAASAMKTLSLAATALERLHAVKSRALGLDKENAVPDELPVLMFRDLTSEELTELQKRDETDDDGELGIPIAPIDSADLTSVGTDGGESDDIVVEGDDIAVEAEEEVPVNTRTAASIALGGGLVRGQLA